MQVAYNGGMISIADRIEQVQARVALAAQRVDRSAESITIVAVSKTHSADAIRAAYAAGLRHFGENRSGEFEQKQAKLADLDGLQWHFIGHLQTRQSLPVAQHADQFHAVDRVKIARRLQRQLDQFGRNLPAYLEVNLSGETSKYGFACDQWETDTRQREHLLSAVATIADLPRIEMRGLMTMAPWGAADGVIRTVFRRTARLRDWLQEERPDLNWNALSMGMTDDFELAIEEGATHLRIGRAIFGERET